MWSVGESKIGSVLKLPFFFFQLGVTCVYTTCVTDFFVCFRLIVVYVLGVERLLLNRLHGWV